MTKSNPVERKSGEKQPGTYHYNPGNMSGKTPEKPTEPAKDESGPADLAEKNTDRPHK